MHFKIFIKHILLSKKKNPNFCIDCVYLCVHMKQSTNKKLVCSLILQTCNGVHQETLAEPTSFGGKPGLGMLDFNVPNPFVSSLRTLARLCMCMGKLRGIAVACTIV